jgi:signal transduction histidine kinase
MLARAWARAALHTSFVGMPPSQLEARLQEFVQQLYGALHAEPFTVDAGRAVGAALVDAHFTNPRTLAETVTVLLTAPPQVDPDDDANLRWQQLVAAVAEGYAQALQERAVKEQQEILDAALTARQEADRALRDSENRLEHAKEEFIATVSHELKTPLTPIKGYLHILLNRNYALDLDRRRQIYRQMLDQAEQLERLVEDLLAASELQQAQFSVTPVVADVAEVVEQALQGMGPASSRHVDWSHDDLGDAVFDPARLQQVIANLLSNADKYSPKSAPIHVSARRSQDVVEITVRDFGPGVPPEQAEAVFEPFRRLGNQPSEGTPGTGLGLYISRRLIESMNGRIWLDGNAGPGASFHATVPAAT